MKNIVKVFTALIVVTLLCGCGAEEKERVIKCTASQSDLTNGYQIKAEYNIYAKGDVVKSVKTKEVVTSDQEAILNAFETTLNSTYETYSKEYGGYNYEIVKDNNTVTSNVEIDYSIMDLTKFANDNSVLKNYMNDNNELTVDGLKTMYKSLGATCED